MPSIDDSVREKAGEIFSKECNLSIKNGKIVYEGEINPEIYSKILSELPKEEVLKMIGGSNPKLREIIKTINYLNKQKQKAANTQRLDLATLFRDTEYRLIGELQRYLANQ